MADDANTLLGYVSDVDENFVYGTGSEVVIFAVPMRDYKGDIASTLKFISKDTVIMVAILIRLQVVL